MTGWNRRRRNQSGSEWKHDYKQDRRIGPDWIENTGALVHDNDLCFWLLNGVVYRESTRDIFVTDTWACFAWP